MTILTILLVIFTVLVTVGALTGSSVKTLG